MTKREFEASPVGAWTLREPLLPAGRLSTLADPTLFQMLHEGQRAPEEGVLIPQGVIVPSRTAAPRSILAVRERPRRHGWLRQSIAHLLTGLHLAHHHPVSR